MIVRTMNNMSVKEISKWEKVRERGEGRFILTKTAIYAGLYAVSTSVVYGFIDGRIELLDIAGRLILGILGGLFLASFDWSSNEKAYLKQLTK